MIQDGAFRTEPWRIREEKLDLDLLAQSESVLALANGHLGLRGNLDEGEPYGLPGTYLNGVYELRPLPYAEAGYGYPESGQTVVNVTDGKLIRLTVGDELFDVRYGRLRFHERVLDLRAGTLAVPRLSRPRRGHAQLFEGFRNGPGHDEAPMSSPRGVFASGRAVLLVVVLIRQRSTSATLQAWAMQPRGL